MILCLGSGVWKCGAVKRYFFFSPCHPSMKQCPLGCGERRLAGAHNSPATLLHLPLHPYHFLTNTETLLTLSPVRTPAPPAAVGKDLAPPRSFKQARRETKEGVRRAQKKNDLFVWISRSGVLFIPSLARKTGRPEDRRARATTGKPRTTMETMTPTVPFLPFPHEQARERNPSPLPKQSVSLTLTPRPPNPYAQELGGEGVATPYLRAKPIRGTATRPSPRQVSKARKERQKQSGRAEEDLPRSHGSQIRPRPAVLTALFTSSSS